MLLAEWKFQHPASVGSIKDTQGHSERHQQAFGEGTIEGRRMITVGRDNLSYRQAGGVDQSEYPHAAQSWMWTPNGWVGLKNAC